MVQSQFNVLQPVQWKNRVFPFPRKGLSKHFRLALNPHSCLDLPNAEVRECTAIPGSFTCTNHRWLATTPRDIALWSRL